MRPTVSLIDLAGMEKYLNYDHWRENLPFLDIPEGCQIQIMPPFCGAIVRFRIRLGDLKSVSVYFDAFDHLGHYTGDPYWEIYPGLDGSPSRFTQGETVEMMEEILRVLKT